MRPSELFNIAVVSQLAEDVPLGAVGRVSVQHRVTPMRQVEIFKALAVRICNYGTVATLSDATQHLLEYE
jgi:hypothetical protein